MDCRDGLFWDAAVELLLLMLLLLLPLGLGPPDFGEEVCCFICVC